MGKFTSVATGLAVIGLAALPPAVAGAAGPVTFGASLAQAPNVSFDCSVIPYTNPIPSPGTSCTWGTPLFNVSNASAGGLDVPGNGNVYQVKLRVGQTTGRMQLVVLRTLFDPNDLTRNECCVDVAQSSVFTPVANGITTLNVDLPVGEGQESNNGATVDFLDQIGLSILEDGVPIPVINDTSLEAIEQQPVVTFNAPAMTLGKSQLSGDPDGYALDMQATWYPTGQSPATVVLPAQTDHVAGHNALVRVDCNKAPCDGTVTVTGPPVAATAVAARASKSVTYASGAFKLPAGASAQVRAKLTSKGRALARKHKKLKVKIVVRLTKLSPIKTFARTVQLTF
jgi:hypothetical protein